MPQQRTWSSAWATHLDKNDENKINAARGSSKWKVCWNNRDAESSEEITVRENHLSLPRIRRLHSLRRSFAHNLPERIYFCLWESVTSSFAQHHLKEVLNIPRKIWTYVKDFIVLSQFTSVPEIPPPKLQWVHLFFLLIGRPAWGSVTWGEFR